MSCCNIPSNMCYGNYNTQGIHTNKYISKSVSKDKANSCYTFQTIIRLLIGHFISFKFINNT